MAHCRDDCCPSCENWPFANDRCVGCGLSAGECIIECFDRSRRDPPRFPRMARDMLICGMCKKEFQEWTEIVRHETQEHKMGSSR